MTEVETSRVVVGGANLSPDWWFFLLLLSSSQSLWCRRPCASPVWSFQEIDIHMSHLPPKAYITMPLSRAGGHNSESNLVGDAVARGA